MIVFFCFVASCIKKGVGLYVTAFGCQFLLEFKYEFSYINIFVYMYIVICMYIYLNGDFIMDRYVCMYVCI